MKKVDWTEAELVDAFTGTFRECIELMKEKNHDYGNSWAYDRESSITDTIRHKLERIINIEKLREKGIEPRVSEGVRAELRDIINYAVFRILMENEHIDLSGVPHEPQTAPVNEIIQVISKSSDTAVSIWITDPARMTEILRHLHSHFGKAHHPLYGDAPNLIMLYPMGDIDEAIKRLKALTWRHVVGN